MGSDVSQQIKKRKKQRTREKLRKKNEISKLKYCKWTNLQFSQQSNLFDDVKQFQMTKKIKWRNVMKKVQLKKCFFFASETCNLL